MMNQSQNVSDAGASLSRIVESARELGVEINHAEALQWLTAVAALDHARPDPGIDESRGIYAHRVVLLDFDPSDLDRLRRVAAIVEIPDYPDVETAIALSGSSAQSHVQTFPGDFDYFERVHVHAGSKDEASRRLGDVIRDKALATSVGPGYQLIEVRFGTFLHRVIRNDRTIEPGASITWSPAEIAAGQFTVLAADGQPTVIDWAYACQDPGWCKLDWVLVDPAEPRAVKASNMLDATWEDADGNIYPLDGFIDPYYQEVYLDADSIPLFCKITQHMDPAALQKYVAQLEQEVAKYTAPDHANYGKAAKRLYNIFRLTGRFAAAAYIRELFDEPAALLYQVGALLDGLGDLGSSPSAFDRELLVNQIDELIRDVTVAAEGPLESDIVMAMLRLRDDITGRRSLGSGWETTLRQMQADIYTLVNRYFETRLRALPQVSEYIDALAK